MKSSFLSAAAYQWRGGRGMRAHKPYRLQGLLLRFAYVRTLKNELESAEHALVSATRYVTQLEALKDHQAERIGALAAELKDREAEVERLKRHLSGGAR